ncbi:MAG: alternative ribosome rescue aminoacyl-tRNA hydrolase ArfB [Phycisphaerales bacterium]
MPINEGPTPNAGKPEPQPRAESAPKPTPKPPPKPTVKPHDAIELGRGAWAPRSAVIFTFSRSGGPGGQNVNKLNTRADLHLALAAIKNLGEAARARLVALAGSHLVGGDADSGSLHFTADESRSQGENREACLERLRALVTEAATLPKKRKKTKPSRSSVRRRLDEKKREGDKKRQRRERFD